MPVPNYIPKTVTGPRVALVGEAPGEQEVREGRPFVGPSGALLTQLLALHELPLGQCMLGNVCQERPAGNKFALFDWDGPEVQGGLRQLEKDLAHFRPAVVVLLGAQALRAALCAKASIEKLRGSVTHAMNGSPMRDYVCMPTYHPAVCFRLYQHRYLLAHDLGRALWIARGGSYAPPAEEYIVDPSPSETVRFLARLRKSRALAALDSEGYPDDMRCLAIASNERQAHVVPAAQIEVPEVREALRDYLADADAPKVFHNGLYDLFLLGWKPYGFTVRGVTDDTMLAEWELGCEFPKSLDHCGTMHTWRPYWKSDRSATDQRTLFWYCGRDATATWEILQSQRAKLSGGPSRHYAFNVSLLPTFLHMELRGIRYDTAGAKARREELQEQAWVTQTQLDALSGHGIGPNLERMVPAVVGMMPKKAKAETIVDVVPEGVRKEWKDSAARILDLAAMARKGILSDVREGELSSLLGLSLNVESPKFRDYLYKTLALPPQYKRAVGAQPVLTANITALLRLRDKTGHGVIPLAIRLRNLSTRVQMLGIEADSDGRIRASYNPVGQETGRVSCYTSPTGSGYNLTTIPEADRDLFLADPGGLLCQCDLNGADGWTIAANLKALGCDEMWDDLVLGLKPAKVIVLMHRDPAAAGLSQAQLLRQSTTVASNDPLYFTAKRVLYGTCYLMGGQACADSIFLKSNGEIKIRAYEAEALQELVHARYHVRLWHGAVMRRMRENGSIITVPSGHTRRFTNRPEKRLGEALAHEPQANTTYATNLALKACWDDPANRRPDGTLRVEPLHHIHDALLFGFAERDLPFARRAIRRWFNNTVVIAGIPVVIPFEGKVGVSWGQLTDKL